MQKKQKNARRARRVVGGVAGGGGEDVWRDGEEEDAVGGGLAGLERVEALVQRGKAVGPVVRALFVCLLVGC